MVTIVWFAWYDFNLWYDRAYGSVYISTLPLLLSLLLDQTLNFFCQGLEFEVVFHAVDTKQNKVVYEDRSLTVETIPLQHRN